MSDFDRENAEVMAMMKNHGSGGELPTITLGGSKAAKKPVTPAAPAAQESKTIAEQTGWEPAKPVPNELSRLRDCATHVLPITAMSAVIFWWQQSGQLAEKTGFYALIVLALLTGLTFGKCAWGGDR